MMGPLYQSEWRRETIHIALAIYDRSGDYARHAGVTMTSVFANTLRPVCAHILHDETLTAENRRNLTQIAEDMGKDLRFYAVQLPEALVGIEYGALTCGALYRLMLPELLPLEKVIYLDGDIVVDMDIAELWETELENFSLAVVRDLDLKYWDEKHRNRVRHIEVVPELYFNSGVMVMNLARIRPRHDLLAELPAFSVRYPLANVPDQDFLNWTFRGECVWLDGRFNVFVSFWQGNWHADRQSGIVWHWAGRDDKPWSHYRSPIDLLYWRYLLMTPWFRHAEAGLEIFYQEVHRLQHSRSWRMTQPYRRVADWLKEKLVVRSGPEK